MRLLHDVTAARVSSTHQQLAGKGSKVITLLILALLCWSLKALQG